MTILFLLLSLASATPITEEMIICNGDPKDERCWEECYRNYHYNLDGDKCPEQRPEEMELVY